MIHILARINGILRYVTLLDNMQKVSVTIQWSKLFTVYGILDESFIEAGRMCYNALTKKIYKEWTIKK